MLEFKTWNPGKLTTNHAQNSQMSNCNCDQNAGNKRLITLSLTSGNIQGYEVSPAAPKCRILDKATRITRLSRGAAHAVTSDCHVCLESADRPSSLFQRFGQSPHQMIRAIKVVRPPHRCSENPHRSSTRDCDADD